jgi:hypothetical protein
MLDLLIAELAILAKNVLEIMLPNVSPTEPQLEMIRRIGKRHLKNQYQYKYLVCFVFVL